MGKTVAFLGSGPQRRKIWLFGGFSGHGRFQLLGGLQNGKIWLWGLYIARTWGKNNKKGQKTVAFHSPAWGSGAFAKFVALQGVKAGSLC